mmetsp:Transcript_8468/g.19919  ORF Transcript_8468/g.19919 Transcript_8468/m.19919 type:complete len:243 (-) Transcript_8468:256-984(-)
MSVPSAQVSTRTSRVTYLALTFGNRIRGSSLKFSPNFCKLKASRVKSICARITSSNSWRLKGAAMCKKRSEKSTILHTSAKSMNAESTTPGCCTFTATSLSLPPSPSNANSARSRALWTCPTEPLAMGRSSKASKSSSTSWPRSFCTICLDSAGEWLGASDRSWLNASITSGGNMSGLMDSHCPNFWKAAPALLVQRSISSNQYSLQAMLLGLISTKTEAKAKGAKAHAKNTARFTANQARL